MRLRQLLILPVLACAGGAGAQPIVVADGRVDAGANDVTAISRSPALREATDAARAHWRGQDPAYEEDLRVLDVAEGAFTQPGRRQEAVLYLMSPWPRCCPKMGIAIVEGGRLVANAAFEENAHRLSALSDFDGDGRDELVSIGEFGMGGQVSGSMTLITFGLDGPQDLGAHSLMESDCGARPDAGSGMAYLVLAQPGGSFTVERFTQPCDGGGWIPSSRAERLVMDRPQVSRYTVLHSGGGHRPSAATAGRRERGTLQSGDETLGSGEYVDEYSVPCRRGQSFVADLRSNDFDPYLIVRPPEGDQLDNDDWQGDLTHSRIEAVIASDGTCRVLVTSYQSGETGAYELTIGD